jgi:glycosyltransferase involved in cell wall biosynthesis
LEIPNERVDTIMPSAGQPISRVVVLSYYHPWYGGGAARPRQFALVDLAKGRTVDFICSTETDMDTARAMLARSPHPGLNIYLLGPDEGVLYRIAGDPADEVVLSVADVLPQRPGPEYVRVHAPGTALLPLFQEAARRGVLAVYDQMDHWEGFPKQPWGDSSLERHFIAAADLVLTITQPLADSFAGMKDMHVVANAVNDELQQLLAAAPRPANDRPKVLYSGAMWPDWFDWKSAQQCARSVPEADFVFLGAVTASADEDDGRPVLSYAAEMAELPNVTMIDEVPHHEIAGHLLSADVGFIPFVVNQVTDPCSPLKVFEYLAAGMPVVSSPLAGVRGYPGMRYYTSFDELRQATLDAITDAADPVGRAERIAFGARNTWSARIDEVDRILAAYVRGRA